MLIDTTKKMTRTNVETLKTKKKKIVIRDNTFTNGETCIRIKGMNKRRGTIEELDIQIVNNEFTTIRGNGVFVDRIAAGTMLIKNNRFSTFNAIALRLCDCKALKQDIIVDNNTFSSIYQIGVCIDNAVITVKSNSFTSSACGVYVYLQPSSNGSSHIPQAKDEMFDSHKDIYFKDMCKDSFIGVSNTHLLGNASIVGDGSQIQFPCRVIIRDNKFKEISKYGVIIQNNSAGSIKVQDCIFINAKEPVVVNEKDEYFSKHNTTKNILVHETSELYAPSLCGTPRTPIKGTIVVKNNKYDGSESCLVRKHVNSYLYDIGNLPIDS